MNETVLIVGCGVMGLSTAVEMAKAGYKVTAMDAHECPSPWSASTDINKIIRTEYDDIMYTKMSIEALKMWRSDPKFKGIYNECGRILITPNHAGRKEFEQMGIDNLHKINEGHTIKTFYGSEELRKKFPTLLYNSIGDMAEVKWNPESGLAHSGNALAAVYREAKSLGVKFIFGKAGQVSQIKNVGGKAYVIASDGEKRTADKVLISSGAATGYLVDLDGQVSATGLFVTHIRLTGKEFKKYEKMPVVFDAEQGYFFPPDPKTHLLKIALPGSGTSNITKDPFNSEQKQSLPVYKDDNTSLTVPHDSIIQARKMLAKFLPELAYHEFYNSKPCWIADTSDSHFIIDGVPGTLNMFVATGDSGHAFKFLPNIGRYIMKRLEGNLPQEFAHKWRWKHSSTKFNSKNLSWRIDSKNLDISEIRWIKEDKDLICKL